MRRRMPIEWKGRRVIPRPIALPDVDPEGPYREAKYRQMWQLIESKKSTSFWWSITNTLNWRSTGRLEKAVLALRQAKYRRGIGKELTIMATTKEGICFRWNQTQAVGKRLEVTHGR